MKRLIVGLLTLMLTATTTVISNLAQEQPTSRPATPATRPTTPTKPIVKPDSKSASKETDKHSSIRPEVIFAKHVIGLVKEKTKDPKIIAEADKLLEEDSLTQIEKRLTERPGNEFFQAERFDESLKEFDKKFAKVKEKDLREWTIGIPNPTTNNVPWPLCLVKGCAAQ